VKGKITLRLEKFVEDWSEYDDTAARVVCPDVSEMSRQELDEVLAKMKVDLDNPDRFDDEIED